jgi:hypothetical protein
VWVDTGRGEPIRNKGRKKNPALTVFLAPLGAKKMTKRVDGGYEEDWKSIGIRERVWGEREFSFCCCCCQSLIPPHQEAKCNLSVAGRM